MTAARTVRVVDSHTAGEPTRVVIESDIRLGDGPLPNRVETFREEYDAYRSAIVREPRGSDPVVGALLCDPHDASCDAGVIFFNNVDYLGMCGHGMIGLIETLKHLGKLDGTSARIETPVGVVATKLQSDGSISLDNVPSYRKAKDVACDVSELGSVVGDVAWGGNWFYLVHRPTFEISLAGVEELRRIALEIRQAIRDAGFPEVDHVELFADTPIETADSQNFVLCPGGEYDRSPCGTGTSAKLACLAADGKLAPNQEWIQAGSLGTSFRGSYVWTDETQGSVVPTITGRAFVTAESTLILDPNDPFCWGIRDVR